MPDSSVDGKTVADALLRRIEISGGKTAALVKREGQYEKVTWQEIYSGVVGLYQSLKKMGVQKSDRVCILSSSRLEWWLADLANLCSGAVTVPIYQSNIAEDVAYILSHSGAKLIYVEDDTQCLKLNEAFKSLGKTLPVVSFSGKPCSVNGLTITPFSDFSVPSQNGNTDAEFRKSVAETQPSDVATIVYTSGTTGRPKGVVLLHSNLAAELRAAVNITQVNEEDTSLTFLPFAHIFARVESLMPIYSGMALAFAEKIETVPQNLQEIKPTVLVSVPRIYEKIYAKIQSEIAAAPAFKKHIFEWASETGRQVARLNSEHKPIPLRLLLKYKIADPLVFSKIRAKLGGRIRISVSGGAPLSASLSEFYHACGIPIIEGYGLTETTAAITCNHLSDFSFGTVGKPMGDTELRIAPDGEILVRGSMVFKEYFNSPEETRQVFSTDGWFATGDIGEITQRGFLRITDRKKEIIVTSAGKNIAPQKLENMLKSSRFISQAIVFGDRQKYIGALITLNEPEVSKWAKEQGIQFEKFEDLTKESRVFDRVEAEVHLSNAHLPSFETIKKFKILPTDLTIEAGELTPSLKVKRKVVAQKYRSLIEQLFSVE